MTEPEPGPVEGIRTETPPATSLLAARAEESKDPSPATSDTSPSALTQIQDRVDRLERALAPLQQLDGLEERLFERVTAYIDHTRPVAPVASVASAQVAEPSILAKASALGSVGKQLLTTMVLSSPPTPSHRGPARPWAVREILAELQAMFYMYVDPRYRLSWAGRMVPPILLGLFLTTGLWVPFLMSKPIELILCFGLIKILSHEARRYRDMAPDLPPSLRP